VPANLLTYAGLPERSKKNNLQDNTRIQRFQMLDSQGFANIEVYLRCICQGHGH